MFWQTVVKYGVKYVGRTLRYELYIWAYLWYVQPTVEHRLRTALASLQGGSITATSMSQVAFNRSNHNLLHNIICIVSSVNIPNNYLAKECVVGQFFLSFV